MLKLPDYSDRGFAIAIGVYTRAKMIPDRPDHDPVDYGC